ncbi:hypothetical protein KDA00_00370 [Candidatus Saccharibacteria bacterium]|nr:hypothetical protein [Candidatus Saccharibacteria bacterium]
MKQRFIITIAIVVFIAGFASLFISKKLFGKEADRNVEVKKVEQISTDFQSPDKQYFNDQSVNPTQIITIGDNQPTQTEQ